jgi:hypothetical protein
VQQSGREIKRLAGARADLPTICRRQMLATRGRRGYKLAIVPRGQDEMP